MSPITQGHTNVLKESRINLYSCIHLFNHCSLNASFMLSTILSIEGYRLNKTESGPFQKWKICTTDKQ